MGRSPCCSKVGLNRGAWTAMEDKILTAYIKAHGEGNWRNLPKRAGLKRCGKSCRLRWLNYLRPDIKRGNISRDEEELILRLHKLLGNRWSLIAGRLPGRTDNEIKNYWNTTLGKKTGSQATSTPPPKETHKLSTRSRVKRQAAVSRTPVRSAPLPATVTLPQVVRAKPIPRRLMVPPIISDQIQAHRDSEFIRPVPNRSHNGLNEACVDDACFLNAGLNGLVTRGKCIYDGEVSEPIPVDKAMLENWNADCGLGETDTLDMESLAFLLDPEDWS